MKKYLLFAFIFAGSVLFLGSCKVKEGCETTEKYKVAVDKNGQMSTKRGKSGLFSDKQMKKKKR